MNTLFDDIATTLITAAFAIASRLRHGRDARDARLPRRV